LTGLLVLVLLVLVLVLLVLVLLVLVLLVLVLLTPTNILNAANPYAGLLIHSEHATIYLYLAGGGRLWLNKKH
jgi:hypothetical protein